MLMLFLAALDEPDDRDIFLSFYQKRKGLMYQVAYQILEDRYLAEDAVQTAFLAALGQIEKLREMGEAQSKGFAVLVTRNKAVDILRKRKNILFIEDLEEAPYSEDVKLPFPVHIYDRLEEPYMSVMTLWGMDYKPAEIARTLDREVQTVYKQIARGKRLLGKILKKEGYDGH